MKKLLLILIMTSLMMPMMMAATQTMKIYPSNDAYVDDYFSSSTFNGEDFRVGHFDYLGSPKGRHRTFLKFNLSDLEGKQINSAFLSMDPAGGPIDRSFNIVLYYVSNDFWNENTLTWNNQPSYSMLVDTRLISTGDRISFDVSSVMQESDKILSLAMISQEEAIDNLYAVFFSSEYASGETYFPYFNVIYEEGGGSNCQTTADTSGDGNISSIELLSYITRWRNSEISAIDLLNAITLWRAGVGC